MSPRTENFFGVLLRRGRGEDKLLAVIWKLKCTRTSCTWIRHSRLMAQMHILQSIILATCSEGLYEKCLLIYLQ